MGEKKTGRFCNNCGKNVLAIGKTPNHILHLILSIITGGLWLIVWIILVLMKIGGYRCSQCGHEI